MRLLTVCGEVDPRLGDLLLAAIGTGARQSELLRLRRRDIEPDASRATLEKTKNGTRRAIHFAGLVAEMVARRLEALPADGGAYLFGAPGLELIEPEFPRNAWERARVRAGFPELRFHDCRHVFATIALEAGADLLGLQKLLGHLGPAMTSRYSHLRDAHGSELVSRTIARAFAIPPEPVQGAVSTGFVN